MKVEQPDLRRTVFDCPWTGHVSDPRLTIRNSSMPSLLGHRCVKCGCLVYEFVEASPILDSGGAPMPKVQEG